jgi:V8-like Glu-specific endopeptidase
MLAIAVLLAAALVAVALLVSSDDPALTGEPAIAPLRVTSGSEIATGFAVGGDRVVTVAHVVDGAVRVGGRNATVLTVDRRSDLALLGVPGAVGRAPAVASTDDGDELDVLRLRDGRSSSQPVRVRRAIVAHVDALGVKHEATRPALELTARVRAGDSGAPVVSRSGSLAGVVFATSIRQGSTAYAVDASAVTRLLARD